MYRWVFLFLGVFISNSIISSCIASTQPTQTSREETSQKKKGFFSKKKEEFKEWRKGGPETPKANFSSTPPSVPNVSPYEKALNARDPYYICFDANTACKMSAAEYEFCQQSSDQRVQDEIYPLNICASAPVQEVARRLAKSGLELNSSKNTPPPPQDDPRTFPSHPSNLEKQDFKGGIQPSSPSSFPNSPPPPQDDPGLPPSYPLESKKSMKKEQPVSSSLANYLQKPVIPEKVMKLAEIGFKNLNENKTARKKSDSPSVGTVEWDAAKGGRSPNWINTTFGKTEDELIQDLKNIEAPLTWSLEEIDREYSLLTQQNPRPGNFLPSFTLVRNVGISGLHKTPLGQEAIVQLASQFNYLEAMSPKKVKVSLYYYDMTQGPLGSIEATAASLHRYATTEVQGKAFDALINVLPENNISYYQEGYLMLGKLTEEECTTVARHITQNIQKLRILPQWVVNESSGSYQIQVFAAAPSFSPSLGFKPPTDGSCAANLTKLIVAKQYEAAAKLAVIRSLKLGASIPLHLTLVGQGDFNNPPSVMEEALNLVADTVKSYKVRVFVHVWDRPGTNTNKDKLMSALKNLRFKFAQEMSREQFKVAQ